jgi:putative redox protein
MAQITAHIGVQKYKIDIVSSANNSIISDEPENLGGKNLGFSPFELLAAALGACTSATIKMYAERKGWDLQEVVTQVSFERNEVENTSSIVRCIEIIGELDPEQRSRLLEIAEKCPVHRALTNPVQIETVTY